nr:restriction endonuclease subunit S [Aquabacterium commune]
MRPLGDFVRLISGNTPSKADESYWNGDTPWISAKDMANFWIEDSEDHLTPAGVAAASRLVSPGTVLMLTRGMTLHKRVPICRTAQAATFNQDVKAVLPREGLSARFLPYLLVGNHDRLHERVDAAGHGTGRLNTDALLAFPVWVPAPLEQDAIASIGEALDERLRLLRETNATLEAIAQALFKSWFVDFDPVRAKMAGRAPEGMDEATAELFPDALEETELGVVPKGWAYQPISEVVEGVYDGPHATPPEANSGGVFLGIKNLTGTALDLSEIRFIGDAEWAKWTKRVEPRAGDIVFSYEATLGFFALIPPDLRCCLGRRLALIRPKGKDGAGHFWFHQFVAPPFQALLAKHTIQGATVNRIALKEFPSYPVLVPSQPLRAAFHDVASGLWAKIQRNQAQAQTLAALRDSLLPRLISGQLRLPKLMEAKVA